MRKFCGRFSLAGKEEIRSKTHNMRLCSAKMCTTNQTQTVCLRLCGELFCFCRGYEVIFMDTRVWSLPCSRFIHSFFRSKARAKQEQLGADVGLAPGQKTAESKVVFEQTKGALHLDGAAKTQMEPTFRHRCFLPPAPVSPRRFSANKALSAVPGFWPGSTGSGRDSCRDPHTGTRRWTQAVRPALPLSPASDTASFPERR